jgi:flagellar biosynthesis protein FlhF
MRIKSYFARTVESAMVLARQELGPEAMLVNSRKALPEARRLGEYEVVFASDFPEAGAEALAPVAAPPQEAGSASERFSLDVANLKKELEGMRRVLTRSVLAPAQWAGVTPNQSDAYLALTMNDVAAELARDIVEAAETRCPEPRAASPRTGQRADPAGFEQALIAEIGERFTVRSSLGQGDATPKVAALAGPPGSGKTTTLVKLAVNYGLSCRRPVLLLSLDTYRVAAADQLRAYAAILGVGFQVLETVAALAQALDENRGKELILIDTPGLGADDMQSASGLARFLAARPDVDTHLVLSSSTKSADLTRMVDRFEVFRPQCLLFTRLDETGSFGPILNEAARTGKPLSFFANGQRIPEDLEAATRNRLVDLVLTGQNGRALSAA